MPILCYRVTTMPIPHNQTHIQPSRINQWNGLDLHLHGDLITGTSRGGWKQFHDWFLPVMAESMQKDLLPVGYRVSSTPGYQIYHEDERLDLRPDNSIYPTANVLSPPQFGFVPFQGALPQSNTLIASTEEAEGQTEADFLDALAVYKLDPQEETPVALFEFISPINKRARRGHHADEYTKKRLGYIAAGIALVEMDFIHTQPPLLPSIIRPYQDPHTRKPDPNAYPFYISTWHPYPNPKFPNGHYHVDLFRAENGIEYQGRPAANGYSKQLGIPAITVPLRPNLTFEVDLDTIYDTVIARHYAPFIDPVRKPPLWDLYNQEDQNRMAGRTLRILQGLQTGRVNDMQKTPMYLEYNDHMHNPNTGFEARLVFDQALIDFHNRDQGRSLDIEF